MCSLIWFLLIIRCIYSVKFSLQIVTSNFRYAPVSKINLTVEIPFNSLPIFDEPVKMCMKHIHSLCLKGIWKENLTAYIYMYFVNICLLILWIQAVSLSSTGLKDHVSYYHNFCIYCCCQWCSALGVVYRVKGLNNLTLPIRLLRRLTRETVVSILLIQIN